MTGVHGLLGRAAIASGATVALLVFGALRGNVTMVAVAAALFVLIAVVAGAWLNRAFWQLDAAHVTDSALPIAARRNARLQALTYGWGGASILAGYYLTPLFWHHAWQYGGAMVLIAGGLYLYSVALGNPANPLRGRRWLATAERLALLQGIAAITGAVYVVVSGKLLLGKADWVGNIVFVSGGLAIAVLSMLAAITQRRLARRGGMSARVSAPSGNRSTGA